MASVGLDQSPSSKDGLEKASMSQLKSTESRDHSQLEKEILTLLKNKERNLKKRKAKLDSYKRRMDAGEKLDKFQTDAVDCLNEVENNLKFLTDTEKDLTEIFTEALPITDSFHQHQTASAVSKVCQVLQLQSTMKFLSEGGTIDFFEVASEESMAQLREFSKLVTPKPAEGEPLQQQLQAASKSIVNFLEGSPKPVMGTTYKALDELLSLIQRRNYFCPSCLTVYNPDDVFDDPDDYYFEICGGLLDICDLGPLSGHGSIGDVYTGCTASCNCCGEQIRLNVVVTATPIYEDDPESERMPWVDHFEDAEIKCVLPYDTSHNQTKSLMDVFEYYPEDYDDDLPSIGEYDFTEDELNLLIIVKTRMNNGYCFIGWDMINGGLVRPILRTATNQCCWQKTDPDLDVGQEHRFQVYSRRLKEIPFPHKSNDVLVHYLARFPAEEITMFDLLGAESCNRVEDVFNGADIKERRYVTEGEVCPSAGIYRCSGKNLSVFDLRFRDGNIKKRCQIIEGGTTYLFPITALQPYSPTNEDVLVIIGLARPFPGYNGEYNPKRCAIIVLGIIPEPN